MNELLSMVLVLVFLILIVGVLFWGLNQTTMSQPARAVVTVLIALGAFVILLRVFGLWGIWP